MDASTVVLNGAERGGGIGADGSSTLLVVTGSEIDDDVASGYGGGVFVRWEATFDIQDTRIAGNTAETGGGLESWESGYLARTEITGNTASKVGGGVLCEGTITGEGNTVTGNSPDDIYGTGCWDAGP